MKIRRIAWLLPLLFCCCHKSNNSTKAPAFTYATSYDTVTGYQNSVHTFSFSVNVLTGSIAGNPITYSITGLPANVTVAPDSLIVQGQLGGLFTFSIGNATAGFDTVNFVSKTSTGGTQAHRLILHILAPVDYAAILSGTYPHSHDYCSPVDSFYNFSTTIAAVAGTPHAITISNIRIFDTSLAISAALTDVVTMPVQTIGSYIIWGTGTYTHDNPPYDTLYELTINDTTVHGLDTEYCLIHIQH